MKKLYLFSGIRDHYGNNENDESREFCQRCLEYGIRSQLKRRMYKAQTNEDGTGDPKLVPATVPDADRFRQCYHCGDIVPLYNIKTESRIADFVEPIDNPFDANPGKMESFTPGVGKNRLNKSKSIYKRRKQQIDSIKDDDVRRELAGGQNELSSFKQS